MGKDYRKQTQKDPYLYRLMSMEIGEKLKRSASAFRKVYPHVSQGYQYIPEENRLWTSSFYPGMMYLAYDLTGDEEFLKYSEDYLDSFEERMEKGFLVTHDIGFLYTLSCVANYKLTGNRRAEELARRAAELLAGRFCEQGNYIQAWGEFGKGDPYVRIIIDTMLNLPLLYWTGTEKNIQIAEKHAETCRKYIMREDGSSYHTYWMDPVTGKAIRGATHQGFADESTWARGQGWAVYGFTLSYRYTKKPEFLETARKAAEVFIKNLPQNKVPYWDFSFTDQVPDIRDTSAAAIFACGLLELGQWTTDEEKKRYEETACGMIRSLLDNYFDHDPDSAGVLREGMYHRDAGANEYTIWGDYFFFEALVRLQKDWKPFW